MFGRMAEFGVTMASQPGFPIDGGDGMDAIQHGDHGPVTMAE